MISFAVGRCCSINQPRLKATFPCSISFFLTKRDKAQKKKKSIRFSCNSIDKKEDDDVNNGNKINNSSLNPIDEEQFKFFSLLPPRFLRESDVSNFDANTFQRNNVNYNLKNGKLKINSYTSNKNDINDSDKFRVKTVKYNDSKSAYIVQWGDGHESTFSFTWIETQLKRRNCYDQLRTSNSKRFHIETPLKYDVSNIMLRIPWSNLTEECVRANNIHPHMHYTFQDIIDEKMRCDGEDEVLNKAIQSLYQYGILLISSTPIHDKGAGVAALASALSGPTHKISSDTSLLHHYLDCIKDQVQPKTILEKGTDGPQRTMFGGVWYTNVSDMTDGTSTADSAYGNDALPLHTDFTYSRDPPGLQIFTMISPAEDGGGESIYVDGLAIAEYMRIHHAKEFDTLCRIKRRYRSIDRDTGWHLEGSGPVIEAIDQWHDLKSYPSDDKHSLERWGTVVGIKHNDLDRLPDLPPWIDQLDHIEIEEEFYTEIDNAHRIWDELLSRDEFRLVMKLKSGDTMVVANNRCLHGRHSFQSSSSARSVMGCYVCQDDLESRFRSLLEGNCTFR
jgi:hypothetical protein